MTPHSTMESYFGSQLIKAEPACKGLDEGYFIWHPEGHTSWSPKAVFEAAFRNVVGLPFSLAFEALRAGHKVRRKGWGANSRHLVFVKGEPLYQFDRVDDCTSNASSYFWLPAMCDLFADDWVICSEFGEELYG